jgi:ATP-dependent Zn protease
VTARAFSALTPLLALVWVATGVSIFFITMAEGGAAWAAFLIGLGSMLYLRGLYTIIRRSLVRREVLQERMSRERRIVDVSRASSWNRILWISVITAVYLGWTVLILGLDAKTALLAAPGFVISLISRLAIYFTLFFVNFGLIFGPFLLFARMGLDPSDPGDASWQVKLSDVRGQKAAVDEMKKILHLIEQGNKFVQSGGLRERGILLVGPPGTGKTMLAKAIASSLELPIIVTSGASFVQMFLGMDIIKVLFLSRMAKRRAKKWGGCAVFIDEFDTLGSRRAGMGGGAGGFLGGMFGGGGGLMALNMLLVVMDGLDNPGFLRRTTRKFVNGILDALFIIPQQIRLGRRTMSLRLPPLKPPRYNIFFMGATNRPQVLDEAVTRPGRFGRQIIFKMPDLEDRKDIADLYFQRIRHDQRLDEPQRRNEFARITKGYSPAMIQQALSVALMYAFEHGREGFIWEDLREAMVNIEAGLAEPVRYSDREALAVARHEVGHLVANRVYLPDRKTVRLTIKKRAGELGHHLAIEEEESFLQFRRHLAGFIRVSLGSIAVERVFYGENTGGVAGDLERATSIAAQMVGLYGMGPDARNDEDSLRAQMIGERLISWGPATESVGQANVIASIVRSHDKAVDVAQVLGSGYVDVWRLMTRNREAIDYLARALVERQELVGNEVDDLLKSVEIVAPAGTEGWPDFLFSVNGGPHLCPRCHRLLPEGSRYCLNCGESIVSPLSAGEMKVTS